MEGKGLVWRASRYLAQMHASEWTSPAVPCPTVPRMRNPRNPALPAFRPSRVTAPRPDDHAGGLAPGERATRVPGSPPDRDQKKSPGAPWRGCARGDSSR